MLKGEPVDRRILLFRQRFRLFTDKQIEFVASFAIKLLLRIENVSCSTNCTRSTEPPRSVERLQALADVSQTVNSTVDRETVLSTIVAMAVQLGY